MSRLTASIFALADGTPTSSRSSRPARAQPSQVRSRPAHVRAHKKSFFDIHQVQRRASCRRGCFSHFRPVRVQGHVGVTPEDIAVSFPALTVGAQSSCAVQSSRGEN